MITSYDDITDFTRIYLNEIDVPEDFAARLLTEIVQLDFIWGDGTRSASPASTEDIDEEVAEGLAKGRVDPSGKPYPNGSYYFDYVCARRVKIWFHPLGMRDDEGKPIGIGGGYPAVLSKEFDRMYGEKALERIVRLALG